MSLFILWIIGVLGVIPWIYFCIRTDEGMKVPLPFVIFVTILLFTPVFGFAILFLAVMGCSLHKARHGTWVEL